MYDALPFLAIFGPVLLVAFTGPTRFWWLTGVLLLGLAFLGFSSIEPVEDDVGGIGALGNGVAYIASIACGIYGGIMLLVGGMIRSSRNRAKQTEQPPPPSLPVARAVAGVTEN